MEKYKTIILIEKIRKCLEEGKPQEALAIAEGIDKKKLKNMSDLSVVAESYFQNAKYEEAKQLYIRIYQKTPSRRIVAQLVHLSIKLNDLDEANHYLKEFIKIAPKDFYQYIFRYSIDKMAKAPLVKLIEDLQDLKNAEYIESWAYELAKLYHKAGMKDECVAECDDIVLWFGSGEYVERANALRAYYRGEIQIDESEIVTKPDEIEKPIKNQKTASKEEETDGVIVIDQDEDFVENGEEYSENIIEENSEESFEENFEDNSEENSEVSIEENSEENSEMSFDLNVHENFYNNLDENDDDNVEDASKVNLKEASTRNVEETFEGNLEEFFEKSMEESIEESIEERFEECIEDGSVEKVTENNNVNLAENIKEISQDNNQSLYESFNDNDQFEEDDFLNLESALAEQLELTFQEREKLSDKEVELKSEVELDQKADEQLNQKADEELNQKADEKLNQETDEELNQKTDEEINQETAEELNQESNTDESHTTTPELNADSNPFAQVSVDPEIEKQVKDEIRRLLKEKDLNELSATLEMTGEVELAQDLLKHPEKKQKKIKLKVLTNEQLIGEEEEDLLMQLSRNQMSLLDIFGNFMRMEIVRKQLVRSMDQILTQRSKNVIITGESQSGKTRLAKCYAKWLHRVKLIQSTKIALIDGEKLNHMNLMAKKEQLKDCVIIIENAGMVAKETMKSLLELSNLYQNNIAIILEDNREKMDQLLRGNSQLNSIFNNRVHLHKYTLEDYMGFAYDYITEHDYEIEMEAFIALQNEFSVFTQKKRENALTAIFSYLDDIIQKSEKRSAQQLKELSQSGRFEDTELMVVKKEDIKS